jgi:glycosyltransferase involved in cell wall biosynthesis
VPRFSIVIPTRARADTLVHALRTATGQEFDDLDILVHESGADAATAAVVANVSDRRVRHIRTVDEVSMTENWERALRAATGEFVTFIGDDDGLLPDACAIAERVLNRNDIELLNWIPACYFWPAYVGEHLRNRLLVHLHRSDVIEEFDSRAELELLYRFRRHYSRLPMIYNSFVSRRLVQRVWDREGHYFSGSTPDVVSGIVNAFYSTSFHVLGRPLSSTGLSHNSMGHRMFYSADDESRRNATAELLGTRDRTAVRNFELFLGNELRLAKERLFPNDAPMFHERNVIWNALQSLDMTPSERELMLREIRAAAAHIALPIESWIPPPLAGGAPSARGVSSSGDDVLMDIDCARIGTVANIADVVRLIAALVPPVDAPPLSRVPSPLRSVDVSGGADLTFCVGGNGVLFLGYGWSDSESWGVWSIGASSELDISVDGIGFEGDTRVELCIEGRMVTYARRERPRGAILCGGRRVAFEATPESRVSVAVTLRPEDFAHGRLVIGIEVDAPRSPAEDGFSGDVRRLGFGLERITLTNDPA